MKKYINKISLLLFGLLAFSCSDDFDVPQSSTVAASFTFSFVDGDYAPASVQFTDNSVYGENPGTITYAWSFGDGTSSSQQNPLHNYDTPGDYKVSFVVTTADDVDFIEKTITIKDPDALVVSIFFIDAGAFKIYDLDGNDFDVPGYGTGIAYSDSEELIYFTDADAGTLMRSTKTGGDMEMVAEGFNDPQDVALDIPSGLAYVTDRGANAIYKIDIAAKTKTVLYGPASGLGELPIGLDLHEGMLYATCVEIDAETVWKGNVDGSGISKIIDYGAGGYGYGIAVDPVNEKIYFDDTENGQILMANLDGTGVTPVINTANRAYGIAVDATNGKIYWTERNSGNVYMANLDGSSKITIGSGYTDPRGLFFIP